MAKIHVMTAAANAAEIAALQERLYALDAEYEQGTAVLRQSFDDLRETALRKQKRQQAADFEYKLQATVKQLQDDAARALQEQKADLLATQLGDQNTVDKQGEIMQLKLHTTALEQRNDKLQTLLQEAQEEIEELQKRKKGFWNW